MQVWGGWDACYTSPFCTSKYTKVVILRVLEFVSGSSVPTYGASGACCVALVFLNSLD